jgi:redox-sensitive bicupin YhaK (pirin superfamily)
MRRFCSPCLPHAKSAEPGAEDEIMIERRSFEGLGGADHGWLKAKHHFSFASYHDPERMGWGALRVWNDDEIAPETGFPPHPHADMEIITYVRQGAITHQDNLGNKGRTEAGDVQVMSAGSGIRHAEYNLERETTRIFQIWIEPNRTGGSPSWGAKPFPKGALPTMPRRCRSAPTRGFSAPRLRRARPPNTGWVRSAMATSSRPRARWR